MLTSSGSRGGAKTPSLCKIGEEEDGHRRWLYIFLGPSSDYLVVTHTHIYLWTFNTVCSKPLSPLLTISDKSGK